ncbi:MULTISPECIES: hypothetical protein [unclassified Methanoregula]|uniref:hypothetical protein n=1 Tax=unclassified Methanoregula TaxID=2649730 RepID=UPI0009D0EB3C|nr:MULTISPECIES: hypothetical protein [unclassified Methanoregula]OPX63993.1 MAG: hypothetical protein A4E33_01014 [Methanoregula sp. PtaB.Bin085]OPY33809.1 MAG: hypothetical protein A4E34_01749 [Methanoregula sp. PtaU1.Bin006]
MRSPEEFLAGCPGDNAGSGGQTPWGSLWEFPGFMARRMYILLRRPGQALGEFGAGDCLTPFLFFLFFAIITGFLRSLAVVLSIHAFTLFHPSAAWRPAPPGMTDVLSTISGNSLFLVSLTLQGVLNNCLFLVAAVIMLAAGLWYVTGNFSWNPAFTISAYCLPVSGVVFTIADFVQAPQVLADPLPALLSSAFYVIAMILMGVIAGHGIIALTKIPAEVAVTIAFCWIIVWMQVHGLGMEYVVSPVEQDLSQRISAAFFPDSYPVAGTPGKVP